MDTDLPAAADYFPLTRGVYDVAPGLRPFGTDFGNGRLDQIVFQLDDQFPAFRHSKSGCRSDDFSKYMATDGLSPDVEQAVTDWFATRLTIEHPGLFKPGGPGKSQCASGPNSGQARCEVRRPHGSFGLVWIGARRFKSD